ncbi:aspartate-semialdehyde dehydrogenase [Anaeromyxobacter diazotrophicus]|uniref:Aspartate-semialdehyde dehydrogenase n=1 Tax=Anaeromyxobacter diazotrophicus TaxID=2590199 RepID=A0A7I9VGJ3_9BACT|nr:aspartate-semialdehyde dehydrogenase [Anaeromyxobacter diazotrophicus]GEJ55511.1 aspartate-semialdehyde dehydrogenase [Anaeromyxobacter diazotrophicus]
MTIRPLHLAVLGATGAVGRALVQALEESDLPVASLALLASEHSAGAELDFRDDVLRAAAVGPGAFAGKDLAFFAAGAATSRAHLEAARAAGCAVVDLTPAFRGDAEVPLVLPPLNADALAGFARRGVVAVPGPASAQLALALAPLHRAAGVERASSVVLEAVSGAGQKGVSELEAELRAMLSFQEPPPPTALPHRAAFNVVPQVGPFGDDGASEEERAVAADVRRLLGSSLRVGVTAVRVPVFYGHVQLVSVKLRRALGAAAARELFRQAPGVKLVDAPQEGVYPMPMLAVNDDAVLVGRVRDDPTQEHGLDLVLCGDNLRQGGASTAIELAKLLAEKHLKLG